MKLLIVESPGKIKTLKKYLGQDWEVAASFGHIRDLPSDQMGVDPTSFHPTYVLNDKGKSVVAKLKSLAASASDVYLASDPDREGESISWHLKEALKLKSYKRITFGEITKSAVLSAIASPRDIDIKLVSAQEARRVLDRLVGYSVSPALSRQFNSTGLSAGRVQSPAVRLVVEREDAIKAFKATNHFGVRAIFNDGWFAEWDSKPLFVEGQEYWTDEKFAEAVSNLKEFSVKSFKEGDLKRAPPAPFTTSTLQQAGSASLKLDPKDTMDAAQKLYEAGVISYMRTDSPNMSKEALDMLADFARKEGLPLAPSFRTWKAKDGAQEGHEAIRPTDFSLTFAGESPVQQKLYVLIRNRAIASQLADAVYATRTAILEATSSVEGKSIKFDARGKTLISKGWLGLTDGDQTDESSESEPSNPIPALTEGSIVVCNKSDLLKKVTKPPARYTLAALVKDLESKGIGRPATYASIMTNVMDKGYISQKDRLLHATDTGYLVVSGLKGNFSFIEYQFTKDLEDSLDHIANGSDTYFKVISRANSVLLKELDALKSVVSSIAPTHVCPKSGHGLRRIKGKSGFFWGCSGYPDCSATYPDVKGSPQLVAPASELSDVPCPSCGKSLVRKKGSSGFFWGCSGYPTCKQTLPDEKGKPVIREKSSAPSSPAVKSEYKCKVCNSALIHRVKEGAYNFWGCSGFPKCKQSYKDNNGAPAYPDN